MLSKIFSSKLINFVLSLVVGVVFTYLTIKLPFGGPVLNIFESLNCEVSLGLPFSFLSIEKEFIVSFPSCTKIDYATLVLDILFWVTIVFFGLSYINKFLQRKNNQNV